MILPAPPWVIRRGLTVEDMACQTAADNYAQKSTRNQYNSNSEICNGIIQDQTWLNDGRFPYCVLLLRQRSSKDETSFLLSKIDKEFN